MIQQKITLCGLFFVPGEQLVHVLPQLTRFRTHFLDAAKISWQNGTGCSLMMFLHMTAHLWWEEGSSHTFLLSWMYHLQSAGDLRVVCVWNSRHLLFPIVIPSYISVRSWDLLFFFKKKKFRALSHYQSLLSRLSLPRPHFIPPISSCPTRANRGCCCSFKTGCIGSHVPKTWRCT